MKMATITRKRLEKAAAVKGLVPYITVEQGNPFWSVRVALYAEGEGVLGDFQTSFNGRGFIRTRQEAMDMLPVLVADAISYLETL
jgi:hypothetical protein